MGKSRKILKPTKPEAKTAEALKLVASSGERKLHGTVRSFLNPFTAVFVIFVAIASISFGSAVNMLPKIRFEAPFFFLALATFLASFLVLCVMLRKYVSAYEEEIKKR